MFSMRLGGSNNLLGSLKFYAKHAIILLRLGSSVSLDVYVFSKILGNTLRLFALEHFQNMFNSVDI